MKIPFLNIYANYCGIKDEIDQAIRDVITDSAFIGGKYVTAFENLFASFHEVSHCVGVANGTDALEIALTALDLPPQSEVIVPVNTFIATAEAVTRSGHRVVFCDCDPETYTISVPDAAKKLTSSTKAIIPVHLYGQSCNMDAVMSFARINKLKILEDCAQAHGAEYRGRKVGAFGDAAAFSFYPGKNLGAFGDAGAIITDDASLAKRCRMIANHGRIGKYDHEFEGRNSRLDGIHAAVLTVKMKYLERCNEARRTNARLYAQHLAGHSQIALPYVPADVSHVYHLYVVRVPNRMKIVESLTKQGIQTGVHYPQPLHLQLAYRHLSYDNGSFPVSEAYADQLLSLPMFPELTALEVETVCSKLVGALVA